MAKASLVTERPLRRDAERNRQRILDAARDLFAQRGLGVTLNDIAHHAGVGVGTVYRRFPDKDELIEALFEQKLEEIVTYAQEAVADPDPWRGLTSFLERGLELQANDRALKELLLGSSRTVERISRIRDRMIPLMTELVARAQAAGALRRDIAPQDMPVLQVMIGAVIDAAYGVQPDLWRRFLTIVLDGMRPDEHRSAELGAPPIPFERIPDVMAGWRPLAGAPAPTLEP
jgi:AcrR family transcriptional regulator